MFFNFELVTQKWNKKSSNIVLVTQSVILIFEFELVTRSATFSFQLWVSNSEIEK